MPKAEKQQAGKRSVRFDFNEAARKVVKDHPELKGRMLFVDAAKDDVSLICDKLYDKGVDDDEIENMQKTIREAKRLKTSFHQEVQGDRKPIDVVIFHSDKFPVFGTARGVVDDTATFDHEMGHALTPKISGALAESTADAYAALRLQQRFGDKTAELEYAAWKRAAIFMLTGVTTHITTFTIDKLVVDAKTADFISLTPAETLAIAKDYAAKTTRSDAQLKSLAREFESVKKLEPAKAFKKMAAITLKADAESDVFYLGARVLKGALQEGGVTLDGKHIELKGKDWDAVRTKLSTRLATLPKNHPLRAA